MKRVYVIGFPLLMAFDTLAQLGFKMAGTHALPFAPDAAWLVRVLVQPWAWLAIACYAAAFLTWMRLLRDAPIGPAFAASHSEVVSVMLVSAIWLGERIGVLQIAGAVAILLGIACLGAAESRAGHEA